MKLILKDNAILKSEEYNNPIVSKLLNISLNNLYNYNFIIFPPSHKESKDLNLNNFIFESNRDIFKTSNIVGVIKENENEVRITSRFYESETSSDYFLRYLLERTLNYNVISSNISSNPFNAYYDLLVYLFPYYLNDAMKKGVYKEYVKKEYNDSNIKGRINFNKHIKYNIPFTGNIFYSTKEFNIDNSLNQLIRHTIEKIESDKSLAIMFDEITKENIRQIKQATMSYKKDNLIKILNHNILNQSKHPYFWEYTLLQKLCIQILRKDKISYGTNKELINGIIIDISWLWEEYLNGLFIDKITHSDNRRKINGMRYFTHGLRTIYPDFFSKDMSIILDAKYKNNSSGIQREDLYQLTSYLHVLNSKRAVIIYPNREATNLNIVGELKGFGGFIMKLGFQIPQKSKTYLDFKKSIQTSEETFKLEIEKLFY